MDEDSENDPFNEDIEFEDLQYEDIDDDQDSSDTDFQPKSKV
jgi:hypothetical protein